MTKETKDLGAATPRSPLATTVQVVPTEEQLATWLMCNVLGKQTDPDWIPEQLLWEPIVIALRQYAADAVSAERRRARPIYETLDGLAESIRGLAVSAVNGDYTADKVAERLTEEANKADAVLDAYATGTAAQPPPGSSAALLEARRLLGEAHEIIDGLIPIVEDAQDNLRQDIRDTQRERFDSFDMEATLEARHLDLERARAFLRSDSERSEPARSESGGSNSVDAPTKEER